MSRSVEKIVDDQIRRWRLASAGAPPPPDVPFEPANVVTLSAPAATHGRTVAEQLGLLLGIPVYDREILEHIATTAKVRVKTVETLDERVQNRMDEYLTAIFRERNFDTGDFVRSLTRTVTALWGHGPCVLVGRGANFIVSRRFSFAVRLVAPLSHRVAVLVEREHMTEDYAQRLIARVDAQREAFVRRAFGASVSDPMGYDLVINMGGLDPAGAARLAAEGFRSKLGVGPVSAEGLGEELFAKTT